MTVDHVFIKADNNMNMGAAKKALGQINLIHGSYSPGRAREFNSTLGKPWKTREFLYLTRIIILPTWEMSLNVGKMLLILLNPLLA